VESDCVVLDCRFQLDQPAWGESAYAEGHIPGACYARLDRDLSARPSAVEGRHPLPAFTDWSARLAAWGIGADTQVVAYDDQGGVYAARLWWMLRWAGHRRVAVLNGGLRAWRAAGGAMSTAVAHRPPAAPGIRVASPGATVSTGRICAFVERTDPELILLDARSARRYRGEEEPYDRIGGHVPGAISRPCTDNLSEDGLFLPADSLRARFLPCLGGRSPEAVVHMCGSGVSACHNLLAMEHAGLGGSRLYVGSWSAWCGDPARPVATGDG
ncbi:MAG TPA: sulfurtransferase, partial [Acidiferrobacteraceae bacterium]|nr:sulfurtransferase [Acidiferrobacteraceae bacterium]